MSKHCGIPLITRHLSLVTGSENYDS
jgi:hypothetical protein